MGATHTDYEQVYADHWRQIVEQPDGSLNVDQVKRELHDYWMVMGNVTEVYLDVTGERFSKPLTAPMYIIERVNERIDEAEADAINDLIEKLEDAELGPFKSTAAVVAAIRDITGVAVS